LGYTIAEKILGAHAGGAPAKAGDVIVAGVDFAMMHDARAGNALRMVENLGAGNENAALPFASRTALVLDHYSPPPNAEAANTHRAMRAFADQHGAVLYDVGDGICHQVLPEGGHFTCGDLVVGTDTHSTTYGAFNAFGTGVEGTDVACVMMTGKLWFRVPETLRVELAGRLQPGVWAKDVTLAMLGRLGAEGANYKAIEYTGTAIAAMEIDDRPVVVDFVKDFDSPGILCDPESPVGGSDDRSVAADSDEKAPCEGHAVEVLWRPGFPALPGQSVILRGHDYAALANGDPSIVSPGRRIKRFGDTGVSRGPGGEGIGAGFGDGCEQDREQTEE
jgi:3-isopropylmalate/(R)-2-methylmalate dehydratase large subunit